MDTIRGSLTEKNLATAFLNETANIRKCEIYSKQAKREGLEQIAAIFLEVAEQKRSHTKTMIKFLEGSNLEVTVQFNHNGIGSVVDCLWEMSATESEASQVTFEAFERIAWEEGYKRIATKFKLFRRIKRFYSVRFAALAENISEGRTFRREKKVKWICRKCGLIYESNRALKNCPGCEHPQAYFEILSENY